MEGLKKSDANLVVYIHPSKAKKVSEAILRELSSLLFKFHETFDGVLLAYDVKILSQVAKILPGIHPYFEGTVVKLGQQSMHAIVLGFSSAIIIQEDIRDEFKYKVKHGKEVFVSRGNKRHQIEVGTIIRFIVKSFDEEVLHICGSLVPDHTGSVGWLDKNLEEWSHADSLTKKRTGSEGSREMLEHNKAMVDGETLYLNTDHHIKKSKRRRSGDS
ncbi:unnamed protein product [Ilex paraguariensis]|uniref:DNA-directed RNA polymerase subunit n=1 Tax=Ilex paraguariensis TaxID=185542 RepID=A0ABC8UTV4_9AQUA